MPIFFFLLSIAWSPPRENPLIPTFNQEKYQELEMIEALCKDQAVELDSLCELHEILTREHTLLTEENKERKRELGSYSLARLAIYLVPLVELETATITRLENQSESSTNNRSDYQNPSESYLEKVEKLNRKVLKQIKAFEGHHKNFTRWIDLLNKNNDALCVLNGLLREQNKLLDHELGVHRFFYKDKPGLV